MKKKIKKIVSVIGVICLVIGLAVLIPSFLSKSYFGIGASAFLVILGLILLAIAFGED